MQKLLHLPQLLVKYKNGKLILIAAKVLDVIFMAGRNEDKLVLIEKIKNNYS